MIFSLHAGHNPDGKVACGACGIGYESTMNREVVSHLDYMLTRLGHKVYNCTVDDGISARDVLVKICEKANKHPVDMHISIHHNAGASDMDGDGRTTGSEVYVTGKFMTAANAGVAVLKDLEDMGYRNRGVKHRDNLYFLNHTKGASLLIECCFVDDRDDMNKWDAKEVARCIAHGLTGEWYDEGEGGTPTQDGHWYKVQTGAYRDRANAIAQLNELHNAGYKDAFIQEY